MLETLALSCVACIERHLKCLYNPSGIKSLMPLITRFSRIGNAETLDVLM